MDDLLFLKENAIEDQYVCLIDSSRRDVARFPSPGEYEVSFSFPFTYVFAVEVVEVTLPLTGYSISRGQNDRFSFRFRASEAWRILTIPEGFYTPVTLMAAFNEAMAAALSGQVYEVVMAAQGTFDVTRKIRIDSSHPFQIDLKYTTLRKVLGFFGSPVTEADGITAVVVESSPTDSGRHAILPDGILDLQGHRYLHLRCPEIEHHMNRNRAYELFNMGMAVVNNASDLVTSIKYVQLPPRTFHPIGKLQRITIRLETPEGGIQDFNGIDHTITLLIRYYRVRENTQNDSVINPNYDPNFLTYIHRHQLKDQPNSSDEEEEQQRQVAPVPAASWTGAMENRRKLHPSVNLWSSRP